MPLAAQCAAQAKGSLLCNTHHCPTGSPFRSWTPPIWEQFNALLRYAFQVTEEELVQVGWQEDEIKQSKFPILESAHVLGCVSRAKRWPRRSPYIPCR